MEETNQLNMLINLFSVCEIITFLKLFFLIYLFSVFQMCGIQQQRGFWWNTAGKNPVFYVFNLIFYSEVTRTDLYASLKEGLAIAGSLVGSLTEAAFPEHVCCTCVTEPTGRSRNSVVALQGLSYRHIFYFNTDPQKYDLAKHVLFRHLA